MRITRTRRVQPSVGLEYVAGMAAEEHFDRSEAALLADGEYHVVGLEVGRHGSRLTGSAGGHDQGERQDRDGQ
jgi:hypothetical protein